MRVASIFYVKMTRRVMKMPDNELACSAGLKENEATSVRVAQQLNNKGLTAMALTGGFPAWRSRFPVEPVSEAA